MHGKCVLFNLYIPFSSSILNDILEEIIRDTSISAYSDGFCVVCLCL